MYTVKRGNFPAGQFPGDTSWPIDSNGDDHVHHSGEIERVERRILCVHTMLISEQTLLWHDFWKI